MEGVARFGMIARAVIYLLVGYLAIQLAIGSARNETDQRGALQVVADRSGGKVLLILVAVGFACYSLWQLAQALFGVVGKPGKVPPRIKAAFSCVIYGSLAFTAVSIVAGSGRASSSGGQSQDEKSKDLSARVMSHTGGRFLVAAVGLTFIVVGVVMAVNGVRRSFVKHLDIAAMSPATRRAVTVLGVAGKIARGAVVATIGVLALLAAVRFDPDRAGGTDEALRTIATAPGGRIALLVAALGLFAFGSYGLAEARWRRT
jgi:hypothetical protein